MGKTTLVLHFQSGRTINQSMDTRDQAQQAANTLTTMMTSGKADTFTLNTGDHMMTVAARYLEAVEVETEKVNQ